MDYTTKRCKDCNIEKPLVAFYKHKGMKDGHRPECKECTTKRSGRDYTKPKNKIDKDGYKICSKCGIKKHIDEYPKSSGYTNGIRPECKVCHHALNLQWRENNPEVYSKRQKENYRKHRDKINKYNREYYQQNKTDLKQKSRLYYWRNHEDVLKKDRIRDKTPERQENKRKLARERYWAKKDDILHKQSIYNKSKYGRKVKYQQNRNRRARKYNAGGTHTAQDIERIYQDQDGRCAYCNND